MIISICGKSGSGKSTLSKEIIKYNNNGIHVDIDKIGHKVYKNKSVIEELIKVFGNNVIKDNRVDRRALGNIVFNSKDNMNKLTDITWKYMESEIDKIINLNKEKIIILDWLLLPKTKYFDMSDIKILLEVDYDIRKERTVKRDNILDEYFDLREKASIDYDKTMFDYVLNENIREEVRKLVKLL